MRRSFLENHWQKAMELQNFLSKNQYFSKSYLPGVADCIMFQLFEKEFPIKTKYPSLFYWFINIKQFSHDAIKSWSIQSDQDKYFQDILNNYTSEYELNQGNCHNSHDAAGALIQFSMNIKTCGKDKGVMQKVRTQISRVAQITKYEPIENQLRINFKCSISEAEVIKGNVVQLNQVQNYEIKKQRQKQKQRSKSFSRQMQKK